MFVHGVNNVTSFYRRLIAAPGLSPANVEAGVRRLPREQADEVRIEASRILARAKPPRCNIPVSELRALRTLRRDESVIILPADKGSATVVMNTEDYQRKIGELLDPENYKKLRRNPTAVVLKRTDFLVKRSSLEPDVKAAVRCSEAFPPRLYGLPKIHKPDVPLRPIVSAIGSPTYHLAKHLTELLRPHIGGTESYVRDSAHFLERLGGLSLQPGDIMVSFDVVSLFTMVPVDDVLGHLADLFPADITALFRHVLKTTYFQYGGEYFEMIDGVAMGSPLSPVVANFYMERFEQRAITSFPLKPRCWFRYVDDTFVIWSHGEEELGRFLAHLNQVHPRIQFTVERETDNQLAFLDVLVLRRTDGSLGHKVYRKPTHTNRYLHKQSNHHPSQKRAVLKTLVDRARRICEPRYLDDELRHLELALQANGYSVGEVRRAVRPRRTARPEVDSRETVGFAALPYIHGVTDRIGRPVSYTHLLATVFIHSKPLCKKIIQ